ncbi:MAG: T9SS type A sorting domain-containing protein [Candidatus Latescibacterota bacterium]|nr:MAG: T9SS type A sorting domain-containing protein [Candidatus Latescibacterota bacterium]
MPMSKLSVVLCLVLVIVSICLAAPLSAESKRSQRLEITVPEGGPTQRVYFHSPEGDERAMVALFHDLVEQGAKHVNCFLPNTVVCELPVHRHANEFVRNPGITVLYDPQIETAGSPGPAFTPGWAKHCYALADELKHAPYDPHEIARARSNTDMEPGEPTVFEVPEDIVRLTDTMAMAASDYVEPRNIQQNSELLLGTVLIQLVLPESRYAPQNNENWSDQGIAGATGQAAAAVIYFQNTYEKIPMNFIFKDYVRIHTTMEPINFEIREVDWIADVMHTLDYDCEATTGGVLTAVHEFNNDKRQQYGTQWVFTAFIANAERDGDHMFWKARGIGWSYLGGPYLVLPYPAGSVSMGQAFKYYMGNIFWATGEDVAANYECDDYSGYLDYRNKNKTTGYDPIMGNPIPCRGMTAPAPCVMNAGDVMDYWYSGDPCEFTAGQWGLIDRLPRNGVADCLDAPPTIYFENAAVETVFTEQAVIRFRAVSEGVPNRNRHQDPDLRVDYRVPVKFVGRSERGTITQKILPLDGEYGDLEEEFEFQMDKLPGGLSTFSVISRNAANAWSEEQTKELFYIGLSYLHFGFQNTNEGTWLEWHLLGDTFDATLDIHRVDIENGGVDEIIATRVQPTGPRVGYFTPYGYLDDTVERGCEYSYYVSGSLSATYRDADTTVTGITHEVTAKAMYPIASDAMLSEAVPNPFNERMQISIRIPMSYRDIDAEFPRPIPTDVKVMVYDVLGRRISEIYSGTVYGQVLTIPWDGTNDNNEKVPAGVYFVKSVAGAQVGTKKIVVVR